MKCYLLLFFISCFATTLTYAQDSSNLNPSPLFNPAKVNEAVDPYFGKENGRIAEMQWSYTSNDFSQGPGSNIPRISIIADDNVSRGDATYEGYDKNGAYLVRQQDGQTFRFNGKNIVKVDLPLYTIVIIMHLIMVKILLQHPLKSPLRNPVPPKSQA